MLLKQRFKLPRKTFVPYGKIRTIGVAWVGQMPAGKKRPSYKACTATFSAERVAVYGAVIYAEIDRGKYSQPVGLVYNLRLIGRPSTAADA